MKRQTRPERLRWSLFSCWYVLLAVVGWNWQPSPPEVRRLQVRPRASVDVVVTRDWRTQALQDLETGNGFAPLAAQDLAEVQAPEAFDLLVAYATGSRSCSLNSPLPAVSMKALASYGERGREVLEDLAGAPDSGKRRLHAVRSLDGLATRESVEALRGAFQIALRSDDWTTVRLSRNLIHKLTGEEVGFDLDTSPPLS